MTTSGGQASATPDPLAPQKAAMLVANVLRLIVGEIEVRVLTRVGREDEEVYAVWKEILQETERLAREGGAYETAGGNESVKGRIWRDMGSFFEPWKTLRVYANSMAETHRQLKLKVGKDNDMCEAYFPWAVQRLRETARESGHYDRVLILQGMVFKDSAPLELVDSSERSISGIAPLGNSPRATATLPYDREYSPSPTTRSLSSSLSPLPEEYARTDDEEDKEEAEEEDDLDDSSVDGRPAVCFSICFASWCFRF